MVKLQGKSDYDRLDEFVRAIATKHQQKHNEPGWTRNTYEIYRPRDRKESLIEVIARVESFATTNGEISIFNQSALPFAQDLGEVLEREFGIAEATIVERSGPI
jgi:hypothetical protein